MLMLLGLALSRGAAAAESDPVAAVRAFLAEPSAPHAAAVALLPPATIEAALDEAMPFRSAPRPRRRGRVTLAGGGHYLYELPRDYDPARPWPLVVSLHGTPQGHCALVHRSCQRGAPPRKGFIVVSPCYPGGLWREAAGGARLRDALHDAARRFHVDWTRIHLDGYSSGGVGAWIYGARWADLFTGVVVRCGVPRILPEEMEGLRASRLFVIHGAQDTRRAPLERTMGALRELDERGIAYEYLEFKGGHGCYARANPRVLDFLKASSRTVPARFRTRDSFEEGPRMVHFVALSGGEQTLEVARTEEAIEIQLSDLPAVRRLDVFLSETWVDLDRPVTVEVNRLRVRALPRRSGRAFVAAWPLYPFHAKGHRERFFQAALRVVEDGVVLDEPRPL